MSYQQTWRNFKADVESLLDLGFEEYLQRYIEGSEISELVERLETFDPDTVDLSDDAYDPTTHPISYLYSKMKLISNGAR